MNVYDEKIKEIVDNFSEMFEPKVREILEKHKEHKKEFAVDIIYNELRIDEEIFDGVFTWLQDEVGQVVWHRYFYGIVKSERPYYKALVSIKILELSHSVPRNTEAWSGDEPLTALGWKAMFSICLDITDGIENRIKEIAKEE